MKRNLLLEELVDCLHFIISIAIDINFDLSHFQVNLIQNNYSINDLFLLLIGQVIYFSNDKSPANFFNIFQYYCFLLNKLNIKKREIMKHYLRKNKINHIRQTNSY
jgi:dimeric dUTPase (all-alpha-NTP-PPase superfamily)